MATDAELTLRIGADATALDGGLRRSEASVNSFAGKAKASLARVGTALRGVADSVVTPMTGLILGGSLGYAIKGVGDMSQQLMYYGMAAKKSKAETQQFRESLHKMAVDTGVDANTILGGVNTIGEITGDFKFSEDMGEVLAKTSKAANTSVEELAQLASSIHENVGWGMEDISQYFNSLIVQGDQGSFTLQKFAEQGKALFSSASAFGIKSKDQFAYFGAALQTVAPSIKSADEITTSMAALFRDLKDKQKDLGKRGIKIFDVVDGKHQVRDFESIVNDIMKKVNGDQKKLAELGLTSESMKILQPLMADYQKGFEKMNQIRKSGSDAMKNTDELEKRFKETSGDFNTNIAKMKASALQFVDMNLAGPVDKLSTALSFLAQHQEIVKAGFTAMAVAAGSLVLLKGYEFIQRMKAMFGSHTIGETAVSTDAMTSVQKVFVTNLRGGGMGGGDYHDDDVPAQKVLATEVEKTTGKFAKFRGGLNSFLGSGVGFMALGAATAWASGKIMEAGSLFMEWRNENAAQEQASADYLHGQQQPFENKYGKTASAYGKQVDEANLAIQKEEKSLFGGSDKKLKELYLQRDASMELMRRAIKTGGKSADDAYLKNFAPVDPSKYFNQNITIRVDAATGNGSVTADKGKAPKLHTTKPFNFNGGN